MREARTQVDGTTLTVGVPDGFQATPEPRGFTVARTAQEDARATYRVELELAPAAPSLVPLTDSRDLGGQAARYGIERYDGGSGGPEVTLVAERPCGPSVLRLRLHTQAEDGEPDLEPAWAVLASARCG